MNQQDEKILEHEGMPRFCCVGRQELHTNIFYKCEERCRYHLHCGCTLLLILPRRGWWGTRGGAGLARTQDPSQSCNKRKNILTKEKIFTPHRDVISLDTQHSSSRSGRIICSAKGQKGIKIDVPLYLDVTMRCYVGSELTAGGPYTLTAQ